MVDHPKTEKSSPRQMEDYLRSLKATDSDAASANSTGDDPLEKYLLERAARDLRTASERLGRLAQSLEGK